jgi:hypothetical protein
MTKPAAHVGDTGTVLIKTITTDGKTVLPVNDATLMEVHLLSPTGVSKVLTASFVTDGTDGQIKATTVVDTWDVAGEWLEQVRITLPNGDWAAVAEKRRVYNRIF